MGCPVNKVVKGGDGSALMKTPELASDIVKAVKDAVDLPVTVKFRLGYTADTKNYMEFAKLMQDSGADAMTIHCRTRSQMYGGKADWSALAEIKKEKGLPEEVASNEMCTFLILNISSLQLIPVSVIAYRSQYGSSNPSAITGAAIAATLVSTATAVIFCKIKEKMTKDTF